MMKKNLLKYCRNIALAGAACLLLAPVTSFSAEYVSVIKDGVNVRTGPGTDSPVYMELFQGYPLQVIEKKGDWLKVSDFEKDSGWIYSSLVSDKKTVIVNASTKANMRSGPTTKDSIVASIERGVVLTVLERKDNWVKVRHAGGTEGWIYAPLLWP